MSDFWLGVLTVPAGALAAAIVWGATLFMFDAYARWNGELWFSRTNRNLSTEGRIGLVAILAHSRRLIRFRLIPGWAVVFSRYDYMQHVDDEAVYRTERALRESLKSDD